MFRELPPQAQLDLGELNDRVNRLMSLLAYLRLGVIYQDDAPDDPGFIAEQLTYGHKSARNHEVLSLRQESPLEMVLLLVGVGVASLALADALARIVEEAGPRSGRVGSREDLRGTLITWGVPAAGLDDAIYRDEVPNPYVAADALTDIVSVERLPPIMPY